MNRISVGASMLRLLRNGLAALLLASGPIFAAIPAWAQDQGDPPADVARIAIISGSVSSHQPGSQDWQAAQQNYPLAPGSGVWTEPRSHAAVDLAGTRIHLDASSQLEINAINQGQVQLSLQQGAAYVRVYPGTSGVSFQIDTAHGAATISQPGQYEIVAGDDQHPASLSVIEGQAQFVGQSANLALQAGQRGNIDPDNGSGTDAAQPDDFVRMVQQQEQPYQQQVAQTAQYVSPQQTGYQDLARYGQWDQAPQYGAVWYPQSVAADWAPYRYGHWAYVAPWGWTWVDDAPWGFTPFHYGRWVQVGHRWAWVPGQRVARPVYAPALVSFFDLGGVGVNLSLGWVPLGPDEVYVPTYRHSQRYVRAVNITNVRNETTIINVVNKKTVINVNNYKNYRGATSASHDVIAGGHAVAPAWGKNGKAKFDQQWARAKPDQDVAFQPEGHAQQGKAPKFNPQTQHQNWQSSAKPNGKANQPKLPEPQAQTEKKWNNNGKPNGSNQPKNPAPQVETSDKKWNNNAKPSGPNQPKIPAPQGQSSQKNWNGNAKPKDNSAKPKNEPYLPPVNGTSQKFNKPQDAPPAAADASAAPKPRKSKNPSPQAVYPTAAPKPEVQPQQHQEQGSKKQWKAQQQNPQAQPQFVPRQNPQESKQPGKQQSKQQGKQQGQGNQPKPNQQQQKPAQNCGQQPGACQ
jgi:hypothetical protein